MIFAARTRFSASASLTSAYRATDRNFSIVTSLTELAACACQSCIFTDGSPPFPSPGCRPSPRAGAVKLRVSAVGLNSAGPFRRSPRVASTPCHRRDGSCAAAAAAVVTLPVSS